VTTGLGTVRDAPERERFELEVDGEIVGFVQYRRRPGAVAFLHTEIDPGHEGSGLGSVLVAGALDEVRRTGGHVLPLCPFVRSFIERHPEYLDLVPEERRAQFGLTRDGSADQR
jgi:predicted GNAT family acetyltransferase